MSEGPTLPDNSQWNSLEQLRYYFFLVLRLKDLTQINRKVRHYFRDMALFVASRNEVQCKSHHQKKNITSKNAVSTLGEFLEDEYTTRRLPYSHATVEFQRHLRTNARNYWIQSRNIDEQIQAFQRNLAFIIEQNGISLQNEGEECLELNTREYQKKEESQFARLTQEETGGRQLTIVKQAKEDDPVPEDPSDF